MLCNLEHVKASISWFNTTYQHGKVKINIPGRFTTYCSSVSFVVFRGIYYSTPDCYSFSLKLVAALIVTVECGAETVADNNSKTMQYVFPTYIPLVIFPCSTPTYITFSERNSSYFCLRPSGTYLHTYHTSELHTFLDL